MKYLFGISVLLLAISCVQAQPRLTLLNATAKSESLRSQQHEWQSGRQQEPDSRPNLTSRSALYLELPGNAGIWSIDLGKRLSLLAA